MRTQMQQIRFSKDQEQAIATIEKWYRGTEPMATLGGLAGTGKTTVTSHLIQNVFDPNGTVVATPTGKAAQVLRRKGVRAETIHSVCYSFIGRGKNNSLVFEFEGVNCNTLVVDEASMVNQTVHDDLMRSGARVFYVGDYGQLPPVGDDPGIMENLTARLDHVHRQGDDLLEFCHAVRQGEYWPYETEHVQRVKKGSDEAFGEMVAADVVICLRNDTRHRTNLQMFFEDMGSTPAQQERCRHLWFERDMVDFFSRFVDRTIRVMCVKNNPAHELWNGTLGTFEIDSVAEWGISGTFVDDAGNAQKINASLEGWGTNPGQVDWQQQDRSIALDLGYCITCHKSQGSEWDNVVVLDETHQGMDNRNRWRYTAATRARKQVVWVPGR